MIKKKLVGIVNYNVGNHTSIINLLKKINVEYILIDGKKNFNKCDILLLPGVGSFAYAIKKIRQKKIDLLINKFVNRKKKVIGICLGMQLLCKSSIENGYNKGLGHLDLKVIKLKKINTGWRKNTLYPTNFKSFTKDYFYFNHSYYIKFNSYKYSSCKMQNSKITSFIKKNNIYGLQFHPEKSYEQGINIVKKIIFND